MRKKKGEGEEKTKETGDSERRNNKVKEIVITRAPSFQIMLPSACMVELLSPNDPLLASAISTEGIMMSVAKHPRGMLVK